MIVQRADVLGNRHFIVIQHHQQVGFDIPAWFIASNAMPAVIAPSPMTHTARRCLSSFAAAIATPIPAEMEVEE